MTQAGEDDRQSDGMSRMRVRVRDRQGNGAGRLDNTHSVQPIAALPHLQRVCGELQGGA